VENEKNFELYVQGENPRDKACKLIRTNGILQVEFKMKSKDKMVPSTITMNAVEVVDQITAAMNQEERMLAYTKLMARMDKIKI
jgi:hypothetical protein